MWRHTSTQSTGCASGGFHAARRRCRRAPPVHPPATFAAVRVLNPGGDASYRTRRRRCGLGNIYTSSQLGTVSVTCVRVIGC